MVCVCVCCEPSCYSECGVICSMCLMLVVTIWWTRTRVMGLVMALNVAKIVSFDSPMLFM